LHLSPDPRGALELLAQLVREAKANDRVVNFLVVGPPDAQLILRTLPFTKHYLDENQLDRTLAGALEELNSEIVGSRGRLIAVFAPSGGSGASIVAANLAVSLTQEPRTVALVDLNLGTGIQDALLDVKPVHNLATLCNLAANISPETVLQTLIAHPSGVKLLAAPGFNDYDLVHASGVQTVLEMLLKSFDFVVVDMDRTYGEDQLAAFRLAETILLVLRLDFTSLRNCRQALKHLEMFGVELRKVRILVNREGQPKEVRREQAESALGQTACLAVPDDPARVMRSVNFGIPVVLDAPRTPVAQSFKTLAHLLNGRVS